MGLFMAVCLPIFSLHANAAESDREYCERQQGPARVACMRDLKQEPTGTAAAVGPVPSAAPGTVSQADRDYCERQQGPARVACMRDLKQEPTGTAAAVAPAPTAAPGTVSQADRDYCERQQGPARVVCFRDLDKAAVAKKSDVAASPASGAAPAQTDAASGAALYTVVNGNQVDAKTLTGFKTWRAAACDRCHGDNQEGLVGPSLINSLKTLSKADFIKTVTHGRLEKGMPSFGTNPTLVSNIDHLYAYLKGRSDGAITKAHVVPMGH